jgi:L-threonylcarbamoyladenylate synthase
MIRVVVNRTEPAPVLLDRAAAVILAGGLVALPTDTLYGLAADPFNAAAVRRVFLVKGRTLARALPLVAADVAQINSQLGPLSPIALALARRFWPGPLTLLVPASGVLAADVTGGTGRVGVRVPAHAVARGLCRACGSVLTATSANLSGRPPSNDPDDVARSLGSALDILLDAGPAPGGPSSTIVDVTGVELQLVRAGAIPWEEVRTCAHRGSQDVNARRSSD